MDDAREGLADDEGDEEDDESERPGAKPALPLRDLARRVDQHRVEGRDAEQLPWAA